MWIKNALMYRFTKPVTMNPDALELQLQMFQFQPCGPQDISKVGFVKSVGDNLVHAGGGNMMITIRHEEKILPAAVIREELVDRVETIESEQGRKVTKKERDALKDEIIHALLPQAFRKHTDTRAVILPVLQMIIVDATTYGKAEVLLSLLRKAIGSLPVTPVSMTKLPEESMTAWVKSGAIGHGFTMQDTAKLASPLEDGGCVSIKQLALSSDEVQAHIEQGLEVVSIAVEYRDILTCTVNSNMSLQKIRFSDEIRDQNDDSEDKTARMDADFTLMCGELSGMLPDLFEALGGLETDD